MIDGSILTANIADQMAQSGGIRLDSVVCCIELDFTTLNEMRLLLERGIKDAAQANEFPRLNTYSNLHKLAKKLEVQIGKTMKELEMKKEEGEKKE